MEESLNSHVYLSIGYLSEKEAVVIDVRKALQEGAAVRVSDDTLIGPANIPQNPKADTRKPWERWPRKVEIYDKDAPSYDGRLQTTFITNKGCGIDGCKMKLVATRAVNSKFEWDEAKVGGQLQYDFSNYRYYLFCFRHGPYPAGPATW